MKAYRSWAVFALAVAFSLPLFPNTYYFAGTINPVSPSTSISISPATPFRGKLTIDWRLATSDARFSDSRRWMTNALLGFPFTTKPLTCTV